MTNRLANFRVAGRNLTRNRGRSLTALLIVTAGVMSMVLAEGFIQWIFWAMREATIESQSGHIQVVRPGFFSKGTASPFDYLLPQASPVSHEIEATQGVKLVAPRLRVTGLISHGETTIPFLAEGVVPEKEAILSEAIHLIQGHNLSGEALQNEVILGRGLARSLGVMPGDSVALLATTSGGGINAVEARVAGVFNSTNQAYDNSALRLPITLAQALLRENEAHVWLVLLEDTEQTDQFLMSFRARFPQATDNLEFVPWYANADFYKKTVALFSKQITVLRLIIGSIIILSISNLLIMNVMERTGEIGTLLAIGFKRKNILQMFAAEGLLLGLTGAAVGLVVGYGVAELVSAVGIPMPPPPGMARGYTGQIRITAELLVSAFVIASVTTMAAGLFPAWKASRQQIVDALRQNN